MAATELPAGVGAASTARIVVREAFGGQFSDHAVDDAVLAASELVLAVRRGAAEAISINAHDGDGRLHVEVRGHLFSADLDGAEELPAMILDAITDRWEIEDDGGEVFAWAIVPPNGAAG